jgi:hypothetical protein
MLESVYYFPSQVLSLGPELICLDKKCFHRDLLQELSEILYVSMYTCIYLSI